MKDWRGRDVVPGSVIVYPGRQGSSMWLMEAVVDRVDEVDGGYSLNVTLTGCTGYRGVSGRRVTVTRTDKVTVVD